MFRIRHKGNGTAAAMREKAQRARDLSGASKDVAEELVRQNAGVRFDPDHPLSILRVEGGRGAIGSKAKGYVKVLRIDKAPIARIYKGHILGGGT